MSDNVRAAGGVVRDLDEDGRLRVLLVHRPKYDDWSFPKGKVDSGESDVECAVREVEEETGLHCEPVHKVAESHYVDGRGRPKVVRYWEMRVLSGDLRLNDEVDELCWCHPEAAAELLSYDRDREVLAEFLA